MDLKISNNPYAFITGIRMSWASYSYYDLSLVFSYFCKPKP